MAVIPHHPKQCMYVCMYVCMYLGTKKLRDRLGTSMLYEKFIKLHGKIIGRQNREGLQEAHEPETFVILKM